MKNALITCASIMSFAIPASAITIHAPVNGAEVTSPFNLVASTETCDSKRALSMGYSIDYGVTTILKNKTSFSAMVAAPQGQHALHVKC